MTLPQDHYPRIIRALDLISQGNSPTKACDDAGITTYILKRYIATDPQLLELAEEAHQRGFDTMADTLIDFAKLSDASSSDTKDMKLISDNIKWYLEKKNPINYGAKLTVENKFTADKAIVEALTRGKQRALETAKTVIAEDAAYVVMDANDFTGVDISEFM